MTETLVQAYAPLIFWPGLGLLLFRILPQSFPRFLGRTLYWVGVPIEIFSLSRNADLSGNVGLTPVFTVGALGLGLALACISWSGLQWLASTEFPKWGITHQSLFGDRGDDRSSQGSFILTTMLGNTGFVGLAVVPVLVGDRYLSWAVFYSVAQNILGTYGLGVFLASYFSQAQPSNQWWRQLKDVITVPSLWAFLLGVSTRNLPLSDTAEWGLQQSVWVVIPMALLLMGMRLSQMRNWNSLRLAIVPTLLKMVVVPGCVGIIAALLGVSPEACLVLVLMSGMPTAFANLILAEEYNLNRDLIVSAIVLSTVLLLATIPIWLMLFGTVYWGK
ncbi:MAG: AEC family transporter [Leptolyngbyaceae cyanobacterium MO_188.B28]|nr:AEC family transporter [Leptolyngbyaceae cyanobacterium MO_188.B28]